MSGAPGSGSGAPSPGSSPAPSSTPASSGSEPSSGGGDSYSFMSEIFDSSTPTPSPSPATPTPAEPAPTPAPAPQPQPAPAPAPSPAEPVVPTPAPAPDSASNQQGTQVQQQPAASPKFDPADPISLAQALAEPANFNAAIDHLAQTQFKMEPTELEALEADVAGQLPKLLAKAAVFSQMQFLTMLSRSVPHMIQRHQTVMEKHNDNLNQFYSAWPTLDRVKHGAVVNEMATRFRQMFPQVTKDQMIEQLGPMVLASQGLPIVAMAKSGQVVPTTKVNVAPQPAPKPAGFVPAAPGTVSQMTTPVADPFGYMGLQE